jgi:pyridoxal 5'-phosphate synthase pdxS subunit
MMQLGAETVFVGSGIFKSQDPAKYARAIVLATAHYDDPKLVAEVSKNLPGAMPGLDIRQMAEDEKMASRGW